MTDQDEMAAVIAKSRLFNKLSAEAVQAIAGVAQEVHFPPDTEIVLQGDSGASCSLIISGKVKRYRTKKHGIQYDLGVLGPGESFGELTLLTGDPPPFKLKTLEETRLVVLPKTSMNSVMEKYPEVTVHIGKSVSYWLQRVGSVVESQIEHQIEHQMGRYPFGWKDIFLIIGVSLFFALAFNQSNPKAIPLFPETVSDISVALITASEGFQNQKEGKAVLVDAMPSESYEQKHIAGAVSLPLSIFDFMYDLNLGQIDKSREIIVYGRTISKHYDEEVAKKLIARGHKNVKILRDGLHAWENRGYPIVQ